LGRSSLLLSRAATEGDRAGLDLGDNYSYPSA
jgi:hypothetical protein